LASEAEGMGVDVLVGFAGSELLYCEQNKQVQGVATNDFGIAKDGSMKDTFQRGVEIKAPFTILSEGARGSLSEMAIDKFELKKNSSEPSYALGFKEVWEFDPEVIKEFGVGKLIHTTGYPVNKNGHGGGFLYTMESGLVQLGYVVGLDYKDPYINLYQEFQLWKSHPQIKSLLEKGKCVKYGARVINQGGFDAVPNLSFPGGALIGCSAGFVDILKIKGTHNAMMTGIMAAESISEEVKQKGGIQEVGFGATLSQYQTKYENSSVYQELKKGRYVKQHYKKGMFQGLFATLRAMKGWTIGMKEDKIDYTDADVMFCSNL
jgi:electron-transferring-flavoprotein dehydrogenase